MKKQRGGRIKPNTLFLGGPKEEIIHGTVLPADVIDKLRQTTPVHALDKPRGDVNAKQVSQGMFIGKRAFVCGNGPSFTLDVMNQLVDEHTFGMNAVAIKFDETAWRPSFYIGTTSAVKGKHEKYVLRGIHEARIAAFCWDHYKRYEETQIGHTIYVPCSTTHDCPTEEARDDFWSDNILERLDKFGVTAFPAMQVAAWLGFNPIYLIGCDGNYRPPEDGKDLSHLDANYRPFDAYDNYNYDELNAALQRAHEIAQVNADRLSIDIVNLSPISVITAHVRGKLGDVL